MYMSTLQIIELSVIAVAAVFFCFFSFYFYFRMRKQKDEYEQKIKALEKKVNYDYLTGVLSRRAFIDRMEKKLAVDPNGTFLIFDVNDFKIINDTFGHEEGDNFIKRYSARLQSTFENDLVGRLGGDEFLVFISGNCDEVQINAKIEKAAITEFSDSSTKLTITSCCGSATAPNNGKTFEELYRIADKALYRSKQAVH